MGLRNNMASAASTVQTGRRSTIRRAEDLEADVLLNGKRITSVHEAGEDEYGVHYAVETDDGRMDSFAGDEELEVEEPTPAEIAKWYGG